MHDLSKITIEDVESKVIKEEQVVIEPKHSFSPGLYAREILVPKGCLIVGHKHKKDCLNILASGKMIVKTSMEDEGMEITGPHTFHTGPGVRKLLYAVEESVFINVLMTDNTDLDKIEEELIEKSETFLEHEKKDL